MGVPRAIVARTCLWMLAWGAALGANVGCGDKADELAANRRQLLAGSERDATESVRVPSLGIALQTPGDGWKLLSGEDARAVSAGAHLGAIGPGALAAAIHAEPLREPSLDAMATERLTRLMQEAPRFDAFDVGDTPARRYAVTDGVLRRAGALWVRHGFAFELRVWGLGEGVDAAVETLVRALTFAEPEGPPPSWPAPDRSTPDWRIRAGIYENARSGLTITAPPDLRLVVGDELDVQDPQADAMLVGVRVPFALTVVSEPVTNPAARASRAAAMAQRIGGKAIESLDVDVIGTRVHASQHAVDGDKHVFGDVCHGTWCHAFHARFSEGGEAVLTSALGALEELEPAAAEAMAKELDDTSRSSCTLGDGFALRDGVFRSFEHGFTYTAPSSAWRLRAGADGRRRVDAASLVMEARRWGLEAAIVIDDAAGDDRGVHHAAVVDALAQRGSFKPTAAPEARGEGLMSEGTGALGMGFVVFTELIGERGLQLVAWGDLANVKAHHKELEALVNGVSAGVDKAVETPPGGYLDRRLGVSTAMPVGWKLNADTPHELERSGTFFTWEQNGRFAAVFAMCVPSQTSKPWATRFVEQQLRERIGPAARGSATSRQRPIAGYEADGASWKAPLEQIDLVVSVRGQVLLGMATADFREGAMDTVIQGFSFID